jgi:hypothetical protein
VLVKDLRRDPRAAIRIDLEDRGTRHNMQFRGRRIASLSDDHQDRTRQITRKYVRGPSAAADVERRAAITRVHIELPPERLISHRCAAAP